MATSFGLWSMARPCLLLLLTILATLSPSATAEICSFWDKGCVDPLAQTAIPFKFDPLFLETMNFFYAFDADSQGKGQAPMIKTGFWIGYQASTNNSVININRTSEIAVRVGNLTGTPSGGNNGCDGVWGSSCSNDLKTYLQETILEYVQNADTFSNPLSNVIHSFRSTPPILPNCSPTLFEVQNIPVISFVSEDENTKKAYVKTHGSPDDPWESWFIDDMSASDQAQQVAVGIIGRVPAETAPKPEKESEIQIEIVCARAPSQGTSSSDG